MSSTFDGLYIARSGVRTARVNLNIAGQNITNANTDGYTRQRVDQSAISSSGYGSLYAQNAGDSYGQGSIATGTSQIRDAFLDAEYRTQNAKSGESSSQYDALSSLEDIFTYTTTSTSSSSSAVVDVLSNEFSNFVSQLQALTSGKSSASESAIQEEAKLLATKFNTASKQLDTAWDQQYTDLTDYGVTQANDLMKNIAALNDQIKSAEVSGSSALELKDERNLMLDQLSQYASIKVTETPVANGSGTTFDQLSVSLADADGNSLGYTLIDGDQYAKFYTTEGNAADNVTSNTQSTSSYPYVEMHLSSLSKDGSSYTAAMSVNGPVSFDSDTSFSIYMSDGTTATATIPAGAYSDANDIAAHITIAGASDINIQSSSGQLEFYTTDGRAVALNDAVYGSTGTLSMAAAGGSDTLTALPSGPLSFGTSQSFQITVDDGSGTPTAVTVTIPAGAYADAADLAGKITVSDSSLVSVTSTGAQLQFSAVNSGSTLAADGFTFASTDSFSLSGLGNSDLESGSFAGYLSLLNDSGEFDSTGSAGTTTDRGIGYYSQLLDTLASSLASAVNSVNSTNDAGSNKPLFTSDGSSASGITAKNIQISSDWTTGYLTMSKDSTNAGDSTDSSYSNITNMIVALTTTTQTLKSANGVSIYSGTIQKAAANVATSLGQDVSSVNSTNTTNSSMLNNIDTSRQSNSSVSLDDEAIDLVQFNQSLTAASRFMTAVDECLETIISSMGVAGRG